MAKDPAFLFYSKDFYEGTRTMLPEERACYIDLLIYQHQNGGFIPNDLKRVLMYCSGCNEATLQATLEAKFKLSDKGWVNEVLEKVISDREEFSGKQKINGRVGQFWKKAKFFLAAKDYLKLKEVFENQTNEEIFNKIKDIEINKAMLEAMLQAKLKHLAIANAIVDVNENKNVIENKEKGGLGEKTKIDISKISEAWAKWIKFKKDQFRFVYKSEESEELAKAELLKLSKNNPELAFKIVERSMKNNWKGLFEFPEESKPEFKNNPGLVADMATAGTEAQGIARAAAIKMKEDLKRQELVKN